jgi:hypothetical protein
MTIKELEGVLLPQKTDGLVLALGCGITRQVELDDVYFIDALFSYDGLLLDFSGNPIAITYGIAQHVKVVKSERSNEALH